jgi:flagellar basal body-associated protein FliL
MEKSKKTQQKLNSEKKGLIVALILVSVFAVAFLAFGIYFYAQQEI